MGAAHAPLRGAEQGGVGIVAASVRALFIHASPQRWLRLTRWPVVPISPCSGGPSRRTGRWRSILLLAAVLRLLYVDAPLLDAHRWRQVDTAFMARAFYESGINPLKPEANWGGAHGYVESEFPLLPAIVAVLYHLLGPDEIWGRLVVAAFSVGAVVLTYLLARMLLGSRPGRAAALLVAVSPSAVFYGRAVMPDTLMVFFSLAALLGFMRHGESRSARALVREVSHLRWPFSSSCPASWSLRPSRVPCGEAAAGARSETAGS